MIQKQTILVELGGSTIRAVHASGTEVVTLPITDFSCLADFLDGYFPNATDVIVAHPSLDKGVIPNSANQFIAVLPNEHHLAKNAEYLNDFEALAWATPVIDELKLTSLQGIPFKGINTDYVTYYIGPGTGLGTASMRSGAPKPQKSEGQHTPVTTVTGRDERLVACIARLVGQEDTGQWLLKMAESQSGTKDFTNLDADARIQKPSISHEIVARGDGLALVYRVMMIEEGHPDPNLTTETFINQLTWPIPSPQMQSALEWWLKANGRCAGQLLAWHMNDHKELSPLIVLGGGVMEKILARCPNGEGKIGLRTVVNNAFMLGLKDVRSGNDGVDSFLKSHIEKAKVLIPTCEQPGLVGLRQYWKHQYGGPGASSTPPAPTP